MLYREHLQQEAPLDALVQGQRLVLLLVVVLHLVLELLVDYYKHTLP